MTPKKILVAVDGSEHSLEAVRYVSGVLHPERGQVVLFHVMTNVPESFWDIKSEQDYQYRIVDVRAWEDEQKRIIGEFMDRARLLLHQAGFSDESVVVKVQPRKVGVARDIVAESTNGYDAVVMGRKGLSELKDLIFGSITNKIIEQVAHLPVWVVGGPCRFRRILVGLDTSEGSLAAVDAVGSILEDTKGFEVVLFHAARALNLLGQVLGGQKKTTVHEGSLAERFKSVSKQVGEQMARVFDDASMRLVKAGIEPVGIQHKILEGVTNRAGAIVEEAERSQCCTIVVGRRGITRIQELFLGRVSNKVMQLAKDRTIWVVN